MHNFSTPWSARHKQAAILVAVALTAGLATATVSPSAADATIDGAWVRTPRDGYRTTVASLTLYSNQDLRLLGVSSPLADAVRLQQTVRHGSTIQPQSVAYIDLKQGQPLAVQLGPNRYQLLVVGLHRGVKEGDQLPLRLIFGDRAGHRLFDRSIDAVIRSPAGYTPHAPEDMH